LDRVSYSHGHIDEALLDACEAAAKDEAQRALAAAMMQGGYHAAFQPSVSRTKATFYETCRAGGIPVPVQILWARNDPIAPVDRGVALFRDIAPRQKATFFSAINRSGNLVFREQPEAFHRTIAAFHDALA
jgi:2-hydroxy-6-oxonona-2,4-dienedioate hydrolase